MQTATTQQSETAKTSRIGAGSSWDSITEPEAGASGLAAAIGMSSVMDEINGIFEVIGTPAEEGGGGKDVSHVVGRNLMVLQHRGVADFSGNDAVGQPARVNAHPSRQAAGI